MITETINLHGLKKKKSRLKESSPSSNHLFFSKNEVISIRHGLIESLISEKKNVSFSITKSGKLQGYCLCYHLDWDSSHFGLNMGRIECGFTDEIDIATIQDALSKITRMAKSQLHINHISISIDCDDTRLLQAAINTGFLLIDTKSTYIAAPLGEKRNEKGGHKIRTYSENDREAVLKIIGSLTFPSRYTRDNMLDQTKVSEMYKKWGERAISERGNGIVIVHANHGLPTSFASLSIKEEKGTDGTITYLGNSLIACTKAGMKSAYAMVARGINEGLKSHPFIEFNTSNNNAPMIRILEAHTCKKVRTSYELTKS